MVDSYSWAMSSILKFSFFVFVLCGFLSCKENSKIVHQRPNVILILTDDQGYGDLGYHGNPYMKTPNLDAFAAQSLELTNFHVGTTCTPTRAGLMTGRNANRNNAWHTIAGCSILLDNEEIIPQVFSRNGYGTAMFGKWHLGDNYPFRPQDRGFQSTFYHGGGGVQQTPDYWNNNYFDDTYFRNGIAKKTSGYCTDVWFNETINYIENFKENPFFLYLAPNAAHGPFNVPKEYLEMYRDAPLTHVQKRFYGMVSNIDDNFGKLVSYLKKTDQFDNTIIIFTTDNGTAAGIAQEKEGQQYLGYNAGLRGTKGSHYDGGHKVPFFISWPDGNILNKTSLDVLSAHVDLLPTLSDLVRLPFEPKQPLDGTSLADVLRGKEKTLDRMLVIDTQRNQLPEKGRNSCVMTSDWRLIDGKELYNTVNDPSQENDVAGEYPEIVEKMNAFYDQWWTGLEPDIEYAEIPLGHKSAKSVLLTIHDMHTTENIPWNQVQIRNGDSTPNGYYSIKVVQDGNYRFKLYRYPPESGLSLNASSDEIIGTDFQDDLPQGKILDPKKAEIIFGDMILKSDIDDNQNFVVLEGKLTKGSYRLKSNFIDFEGNYMPSYYTEVIKL